MSFLVEKKRSGRRWLLLVFALLIGLPLLSTFGPLVFLNRTPSIAKGFYIRKISENISIGDIIVFYVDDKNNKLIKYVAGQAGDEFCIDYRGAIWINGLFAAQINVQKYSDFSLNQSRCETLKKGRWFVLGDHPDSYDSRYFGPIKTSQVIAQVELAFEIKQP